MFPSKLSLLLLGFIVAGTALTYIQAMPVDEYEFPINGIDNEIFEEEISPDKNGIVDDDEVEEGEADERNVFNELDPEAEEETAKEAAEEEEELDKDDEEEFEEEIADAEEDSDEVDKSNEDEEEAVEEEEKAIAEEEEAVAEEEEAAEEEEKAIADDEEIADAEEEDEAVGDEEVTEKKGFPYNWYDKVKKFFKGYE